MCGNILLWSSRICVALVTLSAQTTSSVFCLQKTKKHPATRRCDCAAQSSPRLHSVLTQVPLESRRGGLARAPYWNQAAPVALQAGVHLQPVAALFKRGTELNCLIKKHQLKSIFYVASQSNGAYGRHHRVIMTHESGVEKIEYCSLGNDATQKCHLVSSLCASTRCAATIDANGRREK